MRTLLSLIAISLALAAAGCIFDPPPEPEPPPPQPLPGRDTPENAIKRFIGLYAAKDIVEYEKMFTGDFTFEFSNSADPELVMKYALGWFKADETASAQNLFQGGVTSEGFPVSAARSVDLTLTPTVPVDDNGPTRDPELYKVLLASVNLRVDLGYDITYIVGEAPPQSSRFFLVRGDGAVGLGADQPADANHWYVWNWRDESPPLKPSFEPEQSEPTTWGRLKDEYR